MIYLFQLFTCRAWLLGKKDDLSVYLSESIDALFALGEDASLPVDVLRSKTPLPKHCEEGKRGWVTVEKGHLYPHK